MKKILFFILIGALGASCSDDAENESPQEVDNTTENTNTPPATVAIPDQAFEQALIDLNLDDALDGTVLVDNIDFVQDLQIDAKGIADLTGIAAFTALENLNIRENALTNLDLRSNTALLFVWVEDNELESINVDGLTLLEKIGADRNQLTQIDVSNNTALQLLNVPENLIEGINVSNNSALSDFNVTGNPLDCILVSPEQLDNIPLDWTKDAEDNYSLDCE